MFLLVGKLFVVCRGVEVKREALNHAPGQQGSRAAGQLRKSERGEKKEARVCVKIESLEVRAKLTRRNKGA